MAGKIKLKILVTGAMGFVGAPIVRRLARCHDLTVADRLDFGIPSSIKSLIDEGAVELIQTNLSETSDLHRRLGSGEFDCTVHMAAIHFIPACERDPAETYRSNVLAPLHLLASLPAGSKFLNFSSAAVYKPETAAHREGESVIEPIEIYGWSKKHTEDLARHFCQTKNLSVINIRLFNAVGPGETNPHVLPAILGQLAAGQRTLRLGDLRPKRDFIHVDDIAWALERFIEIWPAGQGSFESCNLGTGHAVSIEDLLGEMKVILKSDIVVQSVASKRRTVDRMMLCADIAKLKKFIPDFKPKLPADWLADLLREPGLRFETRQPVSL
ncbi:MAG: NAD-dependent epimerase/dehydratase family protein [Elusimicrobia bacterium]|nr:NAD-dependent epimerase/dehydratase family protein [Elusimicrobiota bacterium]